jgi:hypothetical protein
MSHMLQISSELLKYILKLRLDIQNSLPPVKCISSAPDGDRSLWKGVWSWGTSEGTYVCMNVV